ncbi:hypothetical protein VB738_05495 [Cyanobium gracile UHCC 0139]|uniref:Uncharacterized protein n=1 Tax=Cyanobium gracile UHCC 0139 TaxID=3110308 RepID=A0ABU5RSK0_9CYAN|nr:hypothetical protein [Cyanobium gracile]MEA5390714.1 hypothetical protein [Cyanobium gracile UHCC 0139]
MAGRHALAWGLGISLALALGHDRPARANDAQADGFNLGCAAGFGLVNITNRSVSSSLGTSTRSPNQLNGGSIVSVPASCSVTPPLPAQPGNGHALVGGNARLNAGSIAATQIFRSQSATVTNGPGTTVVSNAWTTQAEVDALAVASYIGGINASNCTVALSSCRYNDAVNLSGSLTLTGSLSETGGINYYNVQAVGRNVDLNVVGSGGEYFVFNMPTSLTTNQDWTLQGDVDPSKIIFSFARPGSNLSLTGSDVFGTFLLTGGGTARLNRSGNGNPSSITGSLIVINNRSALRFGSTAGSNRVNAVINGRPFNPTALRSVPVPGPLPLLGGVVAFGWSRRLRRRLQQASPFHLATMVRTAPSMASGCVRP